MIPHKWTFHFLMAVGFWNFMGAGIFGFLINLPIVPGDLVFILMGAVPLVIASIKGDLGMRATASVHAPAR